MNQTFIKKKAVSLVRRHNTRDPFVLAEKLGLQVHFSDIGTLCGFYTVILNNRFIVLNANLSEQNTKIILAHEIGHDQLHRHFTGIHTLQQTMLYDMTNRPEFEANLFVAHLLLEEDTVKALAKEGRSVSEIAQTLYTNENLISILLDIN